MVTMSLAELSAKNVADADVMQYAQSLIPGYLNNTLGPDDQAWMLHFLALISVRGGSLLMQINNEIAWTDKTRSQLRAGLPDLDVDAGWQALALQIEAYENNQKPRLWLRVKARFGAQMVLYEGRFFSLWQKPAFAVFASVLIMFQMGMLAMMFHQSNHTEPRHQITPADGSKLPSNPVRLDVIFKENTPVLQVQALLVATHAEVVGGPGALGVWQVVVSEAHAPASIQLFMASEWVQSVQQE